MLNFLCDCMTKDPDFAEIIIVEPKTYALAKQVRNRLTQAVLDITPSVPDVEEATIFEILDSQDLKGIISALGSGIELEPGSNLLDLARLRYEMIILVTEPTDEGRHIRRQVLSFFHRYLNPVLAGGHVFVVPPQDWGSMTPEEFYKKAMDPETREIVQIPGDWTIEEI